MYKWLNNVWEFIWDWVAGSALPIWCEMFLCALCFIGEYGLFEGG